MGFLNNLCDSVENDFEIISFRENISGPQLWVKGIVTVEQSQFQSKDLRNHFTMCLVLDLWEIISSLRDLYAFGR